MQVANRIGEGCQQIVNEPKRLKGREVPERRWDGLQLPSGARKGIAKCFEVAREVQAGHVSAACFKRRDRLPQVFLNLKQRGVLGAEEHYAVVVP